MTGATPGEALRLAKQSLRKNILARRDSLDPEARAGHSRRITEKLLALAAYRAAAVICAYASFGSEFDTRSFLDAALRDGKRLLLPRVVRGDPLLELREVRDLRADLAPGVWGIPEPEQHCPRASPQAVEFLLVPGVAVTPRGDRIGYGGGYYDRLLAAIGPGVPRVLAAFSIQVVDELPTGPHDQRVDRVVTESGGYVGKRES